MRVLGRALAIAGWAVLGALALAGLVLSAAALLARAPVARPAIASAVVRVLDEAIAGRLELAGIAVLPGGALELRGLEVYDPDGHLVLSVSRARVLVDLTALRSRTVGLSVELESPSVLLEQEEDGGISLARAFAASRAPNGAPPAAADSSGGWTIHFSRVELHHGDLWWVDAANATRLEASGLDVVARGTIGPRRARAEVKLGGELRTPIATPLSVEVILARAGDALRVPVLRVDAGGTALDAVAEGDLARRRGRLAVTRLGVSRAQARALVPGAPDGADLDGHGFAEADGETLTAALGFEPAGAAGGRGDAAVAARLSGLGRAAGFDVALEKLDPRRLAAALPDGQVTLAGHGAVAGTSLEDLRARAVLAVARSRVGRGEVTRADLSARVARGTLELERLSATAPGVAVEASGRWRRGGAVAGTATVDARDLAVAARNLAHLAGAAPPALAGRARLDATLSGTADAPALDGRLEAPALRSGARALEGVRLAWRAAGLPPATQGVVEGRIAAVRDGAVERARQVTLRASLAGTDAMLALTAAVPAAGSEPLSVDARGALDRARERLDLRQLAISYPGTHWTLQRPAAIDLRGPSVDRLELAALPQRISVSGGVGPRGALAARAEVARVDLARLPTALVTDTPVRGEVSGHLEATGTVARPAVSGRVAVENGGYAGIGGITAVVDGRLDGGARRASGTVSVARAEGGTVDAEVELPVPLAGRGAEPVRARIRATALPLAELLETAGSALPATGQVGVELRLSGTVGAPSLSGTATLSGAAFEDLEGIEVTLAIEAPGATVRVLGSGELAGRRVAGVEASVPLDLGDLVARPAETLRALERAPLQATASVTSLDLAAVSGRVGIPRGLAGIVVAHAEVTGSAAAPRGRATVDLTGGSYGGWRRLGAKLDAAAGEAGLVARGRISVQGDEALRFEASLGARLERLGGRDALLGAPLKVTAEIPRVSLGHAAEGTAVPLAGTVEGRVAVAGTPRAPEIDADLAGSGVAVKGKPLGEAKLAASYRRGHAEAELALRPPSGGTLRATAAVDADLGIGAAGRPLREAPARVTAAAEALDLAFLPAVAPGLVRTAGGKLTLDLRAEGPLARMSPRGTLRVSGGRLAIAELGEWTDIALDARVTDDAVELARVEVRRGRGTLSASGALRGLRGPGAKLTANLAASGFTVARGGMELATFDLAADATGSYSRSELAVEVNVPRGVVRLPKRTPRALQTLDRRDDIVVGRPPEKKRTTAASPSTPAAAAGEAAGPPLAVRVHLVVPRNLFVKSDDPKVDVELKADVRYALEEGREETSGAVEVVRGSVEPLAARNFTIERGVVRFSGIQPTAAVLDFEARYVNPAATVTAKVSGALLNPELKLTSEPQMSDGEIALLLLTGRTEAKAGSGGVGTITGEEAGKAVVAALATQAFKNLVQDKLPLDTVALDTGGFRAGKYVTDKIYVGYVRRWDADPTKNQNEDEVRVEYQITPRWIFESRYGNAQSGSASLVWSRDY